MRVLPCSLLQLLSGPRPGLSRHRPLRYHCPAEGGGGYLKEDAAPEGSDDSGEGEEGRALGLLPSPRHAHSCRVHTDHTPAESSFFRCKQQEAFWLSPGCLLSEVRGFQDPPGGLSFHKGSFPGQLQTPPRGGKAERKSRCPVQNESSTLGASASPCSSVGRFGSCCSSPATPARFPTRAVSHSFFRGVLCGRVHPG